MFEVKYRERFEARRSNKGKLGVRVVGLSSTRRR